MPDAEFLLDVSQNPMLHQGARELHAVLEVRAPESGGPPVGDAPEAAEGIIIDCSGSMAWPPDKMVAARRAAAAAIDALRDDASFAVIRGTETAAMVYPPTPVLDRATAHSRAKAKRAVAALQAYGGTAMATWLALGRQLLAQRPGAVRHAILLTDGQNKEPRHVLDRELERCHGLFVCDARGIGEDYRPEELLRIAEVLHGSAEAILPGADLAADFRRMTEAVMGKRFADVRIRFRLGPGAELRFLKQVYPVQADLTDRAGRPDPRTVEFITGSWGGETREYHLCLAVDDRGRPLEEDLRAARVDLFADGSSRARPVPVLVHWTREVRPETAALDPKVAHYTGQAELSQAVLDGLAANDRGDRTEAERAWGRAVQLATAAGNQAQLERLGRLVEIEDAAAGRVRLRGYLPRSYLFSAQLGARMSVLGLSTGATAPAPVVAGPDQVCRCGRISPAAARFCEQCGTGLGGPAARALTGVGSP